MNWKRGISGGIVAIMACMFALLPMASVALAGPVPDYVEGSPPVIGGVIKDTPDVANFLTDQNNNHFGHTTACNTAKPSPDPSFTTDTTNACQAYVAHWFGWLKDPAHAYPGTQPIIPIQYDQVDENGNPTSTSTIKNYTFANLYDGGRQYQELVNDNWWTNANSVLKDLLKLNHDLSNPDPTTSNYQYYTKDATTGLFTLNSTGEGVWMDFETARSAINANFSALFRVITVLHTPRPGGGFWRTDSGLLGKSTDPAQNNGDPQYVINRVDGLADDFNKALDPSNVSKNQANSFVTTLDFMQAYSAVYNLQKPAITGVTLDAAQHAFASVGNAAATLGTATSNNASANPCNYGLTNVVTVLTGIGAVTLALCSVAVVYDKIVSLGMQAATGLLADQAGIFPNVNTGVNGSSSFLGQFSRPVQTVVQDNADFGLLVRTIYNRILQILNLILILAMIVVALANILQVGMNNYQIKKIVPGLILGFVVANLSFFAMRASLELVDKISQEIVQFSNISTKVTVAGGGTTTVNGIGDPRKAFISAFSEFPWTHDQIVKDGLFGPTPLCTTFADGSANLTDACGTNAVDQASAAVTGPDIQKILEQLVDTSAEVLPVIFLLILGLLFLVRRLIFFVLFPTAPLAVFGLFFPPLKEIWTKWFAFCKDWLLLPPIASGFLLFSLLFLNIANTLKNTDGSASFAGRLVAYIVGVAALYYAMRAPFTYAKSSKAVMDRINTAGKSAWKATGVADEAKARIALSPIGDLQRANASWQARRKDVRTAAEAGIDLRAAERTARRTTDKGTAQANRDALANGYQARARRAYTNREELRARARERELTPAEQRRLDTLDRVMPDLVRADRTLARIGNAEAGDRGAARNIRRYQQEINRAKEKDTRQAVQDNQKAHAERLLNLRPDELQAEERRLRDEARQRELMREQERLGLIIDEPTAAGYRARLASGLGITPIEQAQLDARDQLNTLNASSTRSAQRLEEVVEELRKMNRNGGANRAASYKRLDENRRTVQGDTDSAKEDVKNMSRTYYEGGMSFPTGSPQRSALEMNRRYQQVVAKAKAKVDEDSAGTREREFQHRLLFGGRAAIQEDDDTADALRGNARFATRKDISDKVNDKAFNVDITPDPITHTGPPSARQLIRNQAVGIFRDDRPASVTEAGNRRRAAVELIRNNNLIKAETDASTLGATYGTLADLITASGNPALIAEVGFLAAAATTLTTPPPPDRTARDAIVASIRTNAPAITAYMKRISDEPNTFFEAP
jgi:hypothetical protein